jgi:hypothetical protein
MINELAVSSEMFMMISVMITLISCAVIIWVSSGHLGPGEVSVVTPRGWVDSTKYSG